ncbi:MAG: hypothetical protein RRA15_00305 [bacterium]|nr:hypothetical protein [bacterium]MDT8364916.1 hypothetical protein [bacterium]
MRNSSWARSSRFRVNSCLILAALFSSLLLLPSVSWAVCVCGGGDGIPLTYSTAAPLTMDGSVADWGTTSQAGTILNDEDNNVCDGPSGGLTDLDAPVQSTGRDIIQFAYTFDNNYLYFYTERTGSVSNTQTFLFYADVDNDGYQEDGEPVIVTEWQGNNRNLNIYIADYNPVDATNGDSTVDSAGWGDGYALPGNLKNISSAISTSSGTYGSANGLAMEYRFEWARLGLSGPTGHIIHVSSTNANKNASGLGAQIDDNLGGCGGGGGTTQYANLDFSGAYSLQGAQSSTVFGVHHLVNLGNGDDAFAFAYTIAGPHSPTVTLYLDDGDAIFDTGDSVIAGTVAVARGGSVDVIIVYGIGPVAFGVATVTTTATSQFSLTQSFTISDLVVDTVEVLVPDLLTIKSISGVADVRAFNSSNSKAIPGASVTYSIQVSNVGNGWTITDSVVITDTVPSGTEMYVGNGSASPVIWSGAGSGLTYSFGILSSPGDDISFTSDSGPSPAYTYNPSGVPDGYDSAVTGFRINPKGAFNPSSSFTLSPRIRVR